MKKTGATPSESPQKDYLQPLQLPDGQLLDQVQNFW